MLTAAAVRTAIDLHRLGVAVLLFAFRPDVAQLPSIMADVIMLILKDGVCHVVILSNIFLVCTRFPLLVVLELDIALYPILFQVQQILLTAVAAVSSNCLQPVPKRFLMFFQNRDQRIVVGPVIADVAVDNEIILYCDLNVVGWL